jgi:hypothetical protein
MHCISRSRLANGARSVRKWISGWLVVAGWATAFLPQSACRVDQASLGGQTPAASKPVDATVLQPDSGGRTGVIDARDSSSPSLGIDSGPTSSPPPGPPIVATIDAGQQPDLTIAPDLAIAPDVAIAIDAPPVPTPSLPDAAPPAEIFCPADPALLVCLPFDGTADDLSPARRDMLVTRVTYQPGRNGQAARFGPGREVQVSQPFTVAERIISVELAVLPLDYPRRSGVSHAQRHCDCPASPTTLGMDEHPLRLRPVGYSGFRERRVGGFRKPVRVTRPGR